MGFLPNRGKNSAILYKLLASLLLLVEISTAASNFPANFVFGDSLVEVGNNNYILTLSKANYFPNGIDFGLATGRFTNGRTIVDIIGQELGFQDYTPPYLAPTTTGPLILEGVNYASGAGGILNHSGAVFGGRINLDAQLDNFANTRQDIIARIGNPAAEELFQSSLYSLTIGSNDFINNYLDPVVERIITPEAFVATMISKLRAQLTRMYSLGARKVVVANVGPIGCIPFVRDTNPSAGDECVALANDITGLYNTELRVLITELRTNLKGSNLLYANVYGIVDDVIRNYLSYGFENPNTACCYGAGRYGGVLPCGPGSKVCFERSKYIFWDAYHPSEATNTIIANRLVDGDSSVIWPINIRQLSRI